MGSRNETTSPPFQVRESSTYVPARPHAAVRPSMSMVTVPGVHDGTRMRRLMGTGSSAATPMSTVSSSGNRVCMVTETVFPATSHAIFDDAKRFTHSPSADTE